MDEPKLLSEATSTSTQQFVRIGEAQYFRHDYNETIVNITHLSEPTADAFKEVARFTYAVPAEEQTKREQEKTKRFKQETLRFAIVGFCMLCLAVLAYLRPELGGTAVGLIGVFGALVAAPSVIDRLKAPSAAKNATN